MNIAAPPTEVQKKDILELAMKRLGDERETWEILKRFGIVKPPPKTVTFTVTAELFNSDTPNTWNTGNLGRVMYHEMRPTKVVSVQDTTDTPKEDPNAGSIPIEEFVQLAKKLKADKRYCKDFWSILNAKLGVPKPTYPPVKVTMILTQDDFENAGVEPALAEEISAGIVASVLEDVRPDVFQVELVNN